VKFSAFLVAALAFAGAAVSAIPAKADPMEPDLADGICPAAGSSSGCDYLITFNSPISISTGPGDYFSGSYDSTGDTLVGVVNNTANTLYSISISSNSDIFGFDGTGVDDPSAAGAFPTGNNPDTTGYGGPDAYFTDISGNVSSFPESGTVNFANGGILPGNTDYFSLSAVVSLSSQPTGDFTPVVEPGSVTILSVGMVAAGMTRRLRRKA
jgi:hypothetical protein